MLLMLSTISVGGGAATADAVVASARECACAGIVSISTAQAGGRTDYGSFCASWDSNDEDPWCAVKHSAACGKQATFRADAGHYWSHKPCQGVDPGPPPTSVGTRGTSGPGVIASAGAGAGADAGADASGSLLVLHAWWRAQLRAMRVARAALPRRRARARPRSAPCTAPSLPGAPGASAPTTAAAAT